MATFPRWTGYNFTATTHHEVPAALEPSLQSLKSPFVVCISGASRGIGAQTAKIFAEAGATGLILTARTEPALKETRDACAAAAKSSDIKISTVATEAGSSEAVRHLSKIIQAEHGRLDVLINNAGISGTDGSAFGKLDKMTDEQFEVPIQVNYLGRFYMIKYLIPIMLQSSDGARTVINITSMASHFITELPVGFNISEVATNRLTEAVAEMYRDEGILAYAVHPGGVLTSFPPGFPESIKAICNDEPRLCGAFLLWLVKQRREWLNGRYLSANWDVVELESRKEDIVQGDKLKMRMIV